MPVRASPHLCVSALRRVNYEYAFYWYLYQDGTIGHEIKLTGELSTNMLSPGEGSDSEFGTMVRPGLHRYHHWQRRTWQSGGQDGTGCSVAAHPTHGTMFRQRCRFRRRCRVRCEWPSQPRWCPSVPVEVHRGP